MHRGQEKHQSSWGGPFHYGEHWAPQSTSCCCKHILERDVVAASSRKAGKDTVRETALSQLLAAGTRVKVKEWQTVRPEGINISVCPKECRAQSPLHCRSHAWVGVFTLSVV